MLRAPYSPDRRVPRLACSFPTSPHSDTPAAHVCYNRGVPEPFAPLTSARRGMMKYLLTSAGIKNPSIHDALVGLLGKPIAESSALCIPTAGYGHPQVTPDLAWQFISGQEPETPMCELGW